MKISGWCSGPNGCGSPRAHRICDDRIQQGLLDNCDCTERGGHNHDQKEDD